MQVDMDISSLQKKRFLIWNGTQSWNYGRFLGLIIIGGISYTQTENGVKIGEGLGKFNLCCTGAFLMTY